MLIPADLTAHANAILPHLKLDDYVYLVKKRTKLRNLEGILGIKFYRLQR